MCRSHNRSDLRPTGRSGSARPKTGGRQKAASYAEKTGTAAPFLYPRAISRGPGEKSFSVGWRSNWEAEFALPPASRGVPALLRAQRVKMKDVLSETAVTYP